MRLTEMFRLDEGGVINAKNDVVMSFRTQGGGRDRITIPSAVKDIKAVARQRHWPEAVSEWATRVFVKWLIRTEGLAHDLKQGLRQHYDDYIADYAFSMPDLPDYSEDVNNDEFYHALLSSLPVYARDGDIILPYGLNLVLDNDEQIAMMFDYLVARVEGGQSIGRMSVEQAIAQSVRWHQQRVRAQGKSVEGADIKTVMEFGDGMKMVRVLTPQGLDRDSECLGHCVGQGGYDRRIIDGTVKIFSLRDKDDNAHATIEVTSGRVVQIKGAHNGPVDEQYHLHVKKFVIAAGLPVVADHNKIGLSKLDV